VYFFFFVILLYNDTNSENFVTSDTRPLPVNAAQRCQVIPEHLAPFT